MSALPKYLITSSEYLTHERAATQKSEYWNGEVFTMAGGSPRHNLISANITIALGSRLKGRQCTVYPSDMRIRIPATGLFTYADVVVVCGKPYFEEQDNVVNPTAMVEVLSRSTSNYDRGIKFQNYRTLPSLKDYLLVEQDAPHVEHYHRQSDTEWLLTEIESIEKPIELRSIGCVLEVMELYDKVDELPPQRILRKERPGYFVADSTVNDEE